MNGITALEFNTPDQQAIFAQAVEDSLTVDATVTNVEATDISRRRRQLLQSGVEISYTLQMAIEAGATASDAFEELVEDLTEAVTGNDSPLATALFEELGATLDTTAFVAPTTFDLVDIKVSTSAPTLNPTVMGSPLPSQSNRQDQYFWTALNLLLSHCLASKLLLVETPAVQRSNTTSISLITFTCRVYTASSP